MLNGVDLYSLARLESSAHYYRVETETFLWIIQNRNTSQNDGEKSKNEANLDVAQNSYTLTFPCAFPRLLLFRKIVFNEPGLYRFNDTRHSWSHPSSESSRHSLKCVHPFTTEVESVSKQNNFYNLNPSVKQTWNEKNNSKKHVFIESTCRDLHLRWCFSSQLAVKDANIFRTFRHFMTFHRSPTYHEPSTQLGPRCLQTKNDWSYKMFGTPFILSDLIGEKTAAYFCKIASGQPYLILRQPEAFERLPGIHAYLTTTSWR